MKKLFLRKTSGLLATLLIVSMLLPIVAFAGFESVTYNSETDKVTGIVYIDADVYDDKANRSFLFKDNGDVIVYVYDAEGNVVSTVYATYQEGFDGDKAGYYYRFVLDDASTLDSELKFSYEVTSAVYEEHTLTNVVRDDNNGGGGGGVYIPPTAPADLTVGADGKVNADSLKNALADGSAKIAINGEFALLPASALTAGGTVTIVADGASYELPLDVLNLEALAKELGVELDGLEIKVTVAALKGDAKAKVEADAAAAGGKVVAGIVEFKIEAVAGDKSVEVNNFGKYVSRTIDLANNANTDKAVGVLYNPATGAFSFVPATFSNGVATLKRNGNSVYTVIEVEAKSFADLAGHWGVNDIEKLANKLIVEGTGNGNFEPKRDVTRAEFAAMVVRALGLQASGAAEFSDVADSAWYASAVAAAAEFGIVKGDGNGKFRPADAISREEVAAMVVRAQAVAGKEVKLSIVEANRALASYTDASKLSAWAKAEVAAAVEAGIVKGDNGKVSPKANASRAEAAVMVLRLLNNADFIS